MMLLGLLLPTVLRAWAPDWLPHACFTNPVFNASAGDAPLHHVNDPRHANASLALSEGVYVYGDPSDAIVLEVSGWDSHFLTTMAAAILLREKVGYNVAIVISTGGSGTLGRIDGTEKSRSAVHANLEVWPLGREDDIAASGAVHMGATGTQGQSGIYTDVKTVRRMQAQGTAMEHWRALERCDVLRALAFDSAPYEALAPPDIAPKCAFACNAPAPGLAWLTAARLRGDACKGGAAVQEMQEVCAINRSSPDAQVAAEARRMADAQCDGKGGDGSGSSGKDDGQDAIMVGMDPVYDAGFTQHLFNNLNLSFRIPFVGAQAAQQLVLAREAAGNATLFYHWQPDIFHSENVGKFVRVAFPHSDEGCRAAGTGMCDFPAQPLQKYAAPGLAAFAGPRAHHLIKRFQLNHGQLTTMLELYSNRSKPRDTGADHFHAACAWLKGNEDVWSPWILNLNDTDATPLHAGSSAFANGALTPIIAAFATLAVVAAVAFFLSFKKNERLRAVIMLDSAGGSDLVEEERLTPDQKLKKKLAELQLRAVGSTCIELADVVTDTIAWALLAAKFGGCQRDSYMGSSGDSACQGTAGNSVLVGLLSVLTALALAVSCYGFRVRLHLYQRAHKLYSKGFPSLSISSSSSSGPMGLTSTTDLAMGRGAGQAKYEVMRMRLQSLRVTWLSMVTENIPMAVFYARLVLKDEAETSVHFALWISLVSMGFKFKSGMEVKVLTRKIKKYRQALVDNGAKLAPGRHSFVARHTSIDGNEQQGQTGSGGDDAFSTGNPMQGNPAASWSQKSVDDGVPDGGMRSGMRSGSVGALPPRVEAPFGGSTTLTTGANETAKV
jgi:hypothetical protein